MADAQDPAFQKMQRFRETRDPDLFREIVEAYQGRVFRLVSSILGPWADLDAEGVCQEIFLRVYRRVGQFQGKAAFASWLYRVAYNTALNARRTARFHLPHEPVKALETLAAEADPLAEVLSAEDRAAVARHLETLPESYRTLIYLHYWKDAGMAEIATLTGMPEGTVKSYLHRARARLRARLKGKRHG